ncbi:to reverse transcriptase [Aspergillus sclerotialis]|uniref:To reverse transcriptase n=1 Tax=Aspergillus sclerotialis TaxID=2070753 RepID=A0A3A2ZRJ7_9EURO|nr:to reverse transcriptase [Aspergillus sclerotialis]
MTPQAVMDQEAARIRAERMSETWDLVRGNIEQTQAAQKKQADKHRREPDFHVGDMVYLSLQSHQTGRPNKKLDYQQAGAFSH